MYIYIYVYDYVYVYIGYMLIIYIYIWSYIYIFFCDYIYDYIYIYAFIWLYISSYIWKFPRYPESSKSFDQFCDLKPMATCDHVFKKPPMYDMIWYNWCSYQQKWSSISITKHSGKIMVYIYIHISIHIYLYTYIPMNPIPSKAGMVPAGRPAVANHPPSQTWTRPFQGRLDRWKIRRRRRWIFHRMWMLNPIVVNGYPTPAIGKWTSHTAIENQKRSLLLQTNPEKSARSLRFWFQHISGIATLAQLASWPPTPTPAVYAPKWDRQFGESSPLSHMRWCCERTSGIENCHLSNSLPPMVDNPNQKPSQLSPNMECRKPLIVEVYMRFT